MLRFLLYPLRLTSFHWSAGYRGPMLNKKTHTHTHTPAPAPLSVSQAPRPPASRAKMPSGGQMGRCVGVRGMLLFLRPPPPFPKWESLLRERRRLTRCCPVGTGRDGTGHEA